MTFSLKFHSHKSWVDLIFERIFVRMHLLICFTNIWQFFPYSGSSHIRVSRKSELFSFNVYRWNVLEERQMRNCYVTIWPSMWRFENIARVMNGNNNPYNIHCSKVEFKPTWNIVVKWRGALFANSYDRMHKKSN